VMGVRDTPRRRRMPLNHSHVAVRPSMPMVAVAPPALSGRRGVSVSPIHLVTTPPGKLTMDLHLIMRNSTAATRGEGGGKKAEEKIDVMHRQIFFKKSPKGDAADAKHSPTSWGCELGCVVGVENKVSRARYGFITWAQNLATPPQRRALPSRPSHPPHPLRLLLPHSPVAATAPSGASACPQVTSNS
jgi:hypothetical protein